MTGRSLSVTPVAKTRSRYSVALSIGVLEPEHSRTTSRYLGGNSFIITPPFSPSAICVTSGGTRRPASSQRSSTRASLLIPMDRASAEFHDRVLARDVPTSDHGYRNALFHLLTSETSCYRYCGQGEWTDYGAELARRTHEIIATEL